MEKKITKSAIKKELKGMWNDTRFVFGFKIARVCWNEKWQYMVIENEDTFEEASQSNFSPIDGFRTQEELINKLYRVINQ